MHHSLLCILITALVPQPMESWMSWRRQPSSCDHCSISTYSTSCSVVWYCTSHLNTQRWIRGEGEDQASPLAQPWNILHSGLLMYVWLSVWHTNVIDEKVTRWIRISMQYNALLISCLEKAGFECNGQNVSLWSWCDTFRQQDRCRGLHVSTHQKYSGCSAFSAMTQGGPHLQS